MAAETAKLAVLLSGRGSNFQAIHNAIERQQVQGIAVELVVSNRAEAGGLSFAKANGYPTWVLERKAYPTKLAAYETLLETLLAYQIDGLVLAGFDRILPTQVVDAYPNRIVNIHPSLLPKYGGKGMVGLAVHQAALEAGELESGCTVHLVTAGVDEGPILAQATVPIKPNDTTETLAARVLEQEHLLYAKTIADHFNSLN